jgi:hypothetical protein
VVLVYAAQIGVLQLALRSELDADLSLTQAAMDLGEAVEETTSGGGDCCSIARAPEAQPWCSCPAPAWSASTI